jgi:hypothetical protein
MTKVNFSKLPYIRKHLVFPSAVCKELYLCAKGTKYFAPYKLISTGTLLTLVAVQLVVPIYAFAETTREVMMKRTETQMETRGICARIDALEANVESRADKRQTSLSEKGTTRLEKLETSRAERTDNLDSRRDEWDTNRTERYEKLMARATTDAQKSAVTNFETAIEAAVAKRRATIDSAISAFRTGIDTAVSTRKTTISGAITTFDAARKSAFDKAKASCTAGTDASSVRTTLQNDLKAATDQFSANRQAADKVETQLNALAETRRKTVETAISEFKVTLKSEIEKLKTAFGEK